MTTTTITRTEASERFTRGNNRGHGYAPYTDVAGDDTVDAAVEAAQADGWTLVHDRTNSDEVAVLENGDGGLMAIGGDGRGAGAWAVDITAA